MVSHTQFARDATSANRKKIWNPSEILGIINTDPGYQRITCMGFAPTQGRRCRNQIRIDNREFITETLSDIAYLSPDSPTVISRLREIAGPALCVRYHQNQAETIVKQWQRKIQQLKPQIKEQKPAKPVQSSRQQEPSKDQTIEDLREQIREMKEFLATFQEAANRQRYQDEGSEQREEQVAKDRQEEERKRRAREQKERDERRQEKERLKKERLEKERLEKERLEEERQEKERLENERRDRKEKIRRERERAAANERIRQQAQKLREEREKEKKEREEWDQLWTKYQEQWVNFRASATREGDIRDAIPWPVKSGLRRDVKASNVKDFFERAVPSDANLAKLMRKECQKWHPDKYSSWLRGAELSQVDKMLVDAICRVVTGLLDDSAGRSSDFLG